jgi:hypothetical protein
MSPIEVVSKVGWELSIEDNDDEVGLDESYWHIVKVTSELRKASTHFDIS